MPSVIDKTLRLVFRNWPEISIIDQKNRYDTNSFTETIRIEPSTAK